MAEEIVRSLTRGAAEMVMRKAERMSDAKLRGDDACLKLYWEIAHGGLGFVATVRRVNILESEISQDVINSSKQKDEG